MSDQVINWVIFGGIFALGYGLGLLNILAGIRIYRSGEKTYFSRKYIPDRWYLKFDKNTGYEPVKVTGKAARSAQGCCS